MSAPQKTQNPRIRLRVISAPGVGAVVSAPPALWLAACTHTIDYTCGHCDAILMHAEEGQVHNLMIHCQACGSYNTTET